MERVENTKKRQRVNNFGLKGLLLLVSIGIISGFCISDAQAAPIVEILNLTI